MEIVAAHQAFEGDPAVKWLAMSPSSRKVTGSIPKVFPCGVCARVDGGSLLLRLVPAHNMKSCTFNCTVKVLMVTCLSEVNR